MIDHVTSATAMVLPVGRLPEGGRWRRLVRVSAAAYNDIGQMERLASALSRLVEAGPA